MSKRYYEESYNYPYVIKSITERVILYCAQSIYPDETLENAMKRMIIANFDDDSRAIARSIDVYKTSQGKFPFTAYNIGDVEDYDYKTYYQMSGNYYSPQLEAYVRYVPIKFTIPMVTFLSTPYDLWRVLSNFKNDNSSLTRLDVPVTINDKLTSFSIDVGFLAEKGSLAFDIEQQFGYGKLYPAVHTAEVNCAYITVDLERSPTTQAINQNKIVYHVDDIILRLNELQDSKNLDNNPLIDSITSPETPIISSSIPVNDATGIAVDSAIVLNFNVSMNESSVISNMDIVPYFDKDITFDIESKIMTITPRGNLSNSTEYEILINNNAQSSDLQTLEDDYTLTFTTEA